MTKAKIGTECVRVAQLGDWSEVSCKLPSGTAHGFVKNELVANEKPTVEALLAGVASAPDAKSRFEIYARVLGLDPTRSADVMAARRDFFTQELQLLADIRANPDRKKPRVTAATCQPRDDACVRSALGLRGRPTLSWQASSYVAVDWLGDGEVKAKEVMGTVAGPAGKLIVENEISYRDPPDVFRLMFDVPSGGAAPDDQASGQNAGSIAAIFGDQGAVQDARALAKARALDEARIQAASGSVPSGSGAAQVKMGVPVVLGSLDTEIIRRIVQEHASQIRYCYEKELTRTPGVFGKIVLKWVINGEGKVTHAQTAETQMRNADVETCLVTKIKTWVFPKPKGGGIVIVNFPFSFAPKDG